MNQIIEHYKEALPLKVDAQLIEIEYIHVTTGKAKFLKCCSNLNCHNIPVHLY